jgi:hypothetical protein
VIKMIVLLSIHKSLEDIDSFVPALRWISLPLERVEFWATCQVIHEPPELGERGTKWGWWCLWS